MAAAKDHASLQCPIGLDLFVEPITLPCCGQCVSRQPLLVHLALRTTCPMCNADLSAFDAQRAPVSVAINDLVEEVRREEKKKKVQQLSTSDSKWRGSIQPLALSDLRNVGRLDIEPVDASFRFRTLLIVVVDRSGSMAGSPIKQVKYSLQRILELAYNQPDMVTELVTYNDKATTIEVDRAQQQMAYYAHMVDQISADGGTSFQAAFDQVINVIRHHASRKDLSTATIVLLTDGEDSAVPTDKRGGLVDTFKSAVDALWLPKPYTVHTIGFASAHDFNFLDRLRRAGSIEGAYRYADPQQDTESLSNKVNSLLNVIRKSADVPMRIVSSPVPTLGQQGTAHWLDLTDVPLSCSGDEKQASKGDKKTSTMQFLVDINGKQETVVATLGQLIRGPLERNLGHGAAIVQLEQWYSFLIDEMAAELALLSDALKLKQQAADAKTSSSMTLSQQLHCELLQQRMAALGPRLGANSANATRLDQLLPALQLIRDSASGLSTIKAINLSQQMSDLKSEGLFATKKTTATTASSRADAKHQAQTAATSTATSCSSSPWSTLYVDANWRRIKVPQTAEQVWHVVHNSSNEGACNWMAQHVDELLDAGTDAGGYTPLMRATSIGRAPLVEAMLEAKADPSVQNNQGLNAVDLAIVDGGWHRCYQHFSAAGARPSSNGQVLLQTCLDKGYFEMAGLLLRDNLAHVDKDMLLHVPADKPAAASWITTRLNTNVSLETAIVKGLVDVVRTKLSATKEAEAEAKDEKKAAAAPAPLRLSFRPYVDVLFVAPTPQHVQIVDLILSAGIAQVDEELPLVSSSEQHDNDKKQDDKKEDEEQAQRQQQQEEEEQQQDSKRMTSTTDVQRFTWPLFIACEHGQTELVRVLLRHMQEGDKINKVNHRGTSVLWIAAAMRHVDVVAELLQAGADPNLVNRKGNPPLFAAALKGAGLIVDLLLDAKANVRLHDPRRDTTIIMCCRLGQAKVLEQLLLRVNSEDAKVNASSNTNANVKAAAASTLLNDATPSVVDGLSALQAAVEQERMECVKTCLKYGADMTKCTADDNAMLPGANALHVAAFFGKYHALMALVNAGGPEMLQSRTRVHGWTPLHLAVKKGHPETIRYILTKREGKESSNLADNDGKIPRDYANAALLHEFFSNKLGRLLHQVVYCNLETEQEQCIKVLIHFGRSPGCLEYEDVLATTLESDGGGGQGEVDVSVGADFPTACVLRNSPTLAACLPQLGVDLHKTWSRRSAMTPACWAALLDAKIAEASSGAKMTPMETEMLERIKVSEHKSLQNKYILRTMGAPPTSSNNKNKTWSNDSKDKPPVAPAADGGFLLDVRMRPDVLKTLQMSAAPSSSPPSLLGFLNQFKKQAAAIGVQRADELLWQARLNVVDKVATMTAVVMEEKKSKDQQPQQRQLDPAQLLSIYLYTSEAAIKRAVNGCLTSWNQQNQAAAYWQPLALGLFQALATLPPSNATYVYRSAPDVSFDGKTMAIGSRLKWLSFVTCSLDWQSCSELVRRKHGVIFMVQLLSNNKSRARLVQPYARSAAQAEVMLLPGTEFEVTGHYRGHLAALAQQAKEKRSYVAKTSDLEDCACQQACLVIELSEVSM